MKTQAYHLTSMRDAFDRASLSPRGSRAGIKRVNTFWQVTINGKPKQRLRRS